MRPVRIFGGYCPRVRRWPMLKWFTRKRTIWLSGASVVVALLVWAFATIPAHDVHSPGATALTVKVYLSDQDLMMSDTPPAVASESLDEIRCSVFAHTRVGPASNSGRPCDPAAVRSTIFASAVQAANTLYLAWTGCVEWHGAGAYIRWQGFNFEYMPSSRTVIVHCYISKPHFWIPEQLFGLAAFRPPSLIAIPTSSIASGSLTIDEDDRIEHLLGDQSDEYRLTSAVVG